MTKSDRHPVKLPRELYTKVTTYASKGYNSPTTHIITAVEEYLEKRGANQTEAAPAPKPQFVVPPQGPIVVDKWGNVVTAAKPTSWDELPDDGYVDDNGKWRFGEKPVKHGLTPEEQAKLLAELDD